MGTTKDEDEKAILINAVPSILRGDLEEVVSILSFERTVRLLNDQFYTVTNLISFDGQVVSLDGELLTIPARIYFREPNAAQEKKLTPVQRTLLNCIFLRHHDGFVRQKRLEQIINSTEYFITPFTFHLLGDYVLEIIEVFDRHITNELIDNYVKFINENKKYWQKTESRVISYWNVYYRRPRYPKLKDFVGMKIIDRIKAAI